MKALKDKNWKASQSCFIKFQAELIEGHQTNLKGRYGSNNLVSIKEDFEKLSQDTEEGGIH